ncbi:MAG: hypothetical protein ABR985_20725 [Methanotrichaceae archaeon]
MKASRVVWLFSVFGPLGTWRTLKDLDLREIVGCSSKSMIRYRMVKGY